MAILSHIALQPETGSLCVHRQASMPGSSEQTILELRQVTCGYASNRPAIWNISFSAQKGDILCLLGPSGCGKTTTLRAIAGFERISEGEIYLNDQ